MEKQKISKAEKELIEFREKCLICSLDELTTICVKCYKYGLNNVSSNELKKFIYSFISDKEVYKKQIFKKELGVK